jgi:L-malate glycosyltransferase
MKIAWITSGFSANEKDYGGAATIHNLARELSQHPDIELTIFSFYYPVRKREYYFYGADVFSFAKEDYTRLDKLKIWRQCMKKFSELHSLRKFDLIHAMWANEPGHIASKLSRRFNLPLVVNICGGELAEIKEINYGARLKFFQKRFIDKSFKHASRIVYGSDYILDKINKYYPETIVDKSVKITFGVDEKMFYPGSESPFHHTLINIASEVPVKNHIALFNGIKIVSQRYSDILLKVYGRDDKNVLKKMVVQMNLEKNIQVMGFVDYGKIPEALNNADIYVSSSLYESQNMSLLEAAFCGLPVISTDTGAAKEVTENIVQPGNMAEKITEVIENYSNEKQKALNEIPKLKDKFSLENAVKNFVNVYKSLA